ncbi:LysR family transcriptional regulator [Pseudomonas sp.]|uniref:LysR family transcriptional regulator n=1 Tax=Pseudomonas sp. TaxID=306 RepID=UPI00272F6F18|nr:LysR family transcriptional regulator [Pseudomonas sp.]MDP2243382.1 LysR family transcriptional regulator [Pseudomonas sp.]
MAKLSHRQAEAFRAVMIAGTITGAAEILCVSQPAVSRLLADFEHAVQLRLFERHKKRLTPTPEALILFEEVEKSFVGIEKLARTADELRGYHRGTLRIATMPAVSIGFLPNVVQEFISDHRGVSVTLQVRSSQQVADWIATQHYDVGIVATTVSDPAIDVQPLADSRMVCVLPAGHPLANKMVITPEDLKGESFISLGTEQSVRYKVDEVFERAGVSRQLIVDTQLCYVACSFVLAGSGVTLADPLTALHFAPQGLVVKRFEPRISFVYNILYPAQRAKSRLTLEFIDTLRRKLAQLAVSSSGLLDFEAPPHDHAERT